MSQRKYAFVLLIAGIAAFFMILVTLCTISFPWSSPIVGFIIVGVVLLFTGVSGSLYINSASMLLKHKRRHILLVANSIGVGIFLWGIFAINYLIVIISYLPLAIAAAISLSLLPWAKQRHRTSELPTPLHSSASRFREQRNRRKNKDTIQIEKSNQLI